MPEYIDSNIPIACSECNFVFEGIPAMEQHILEVHPNYSPEEAIEYTRTWADSAYDEINAHNAWRTEEYRRTGIDPEDIDRDSL